MSHMDYSEYRDGCWLGIYGAWDETYGGGHWIQKSNCLSYVMSVAFFVYGISLAECFSVAVYKDICYNLSKQRRSHENRTFLLKDICETL